MFPVHLKLARIHPTFSDDGKPMVDVCFFYNIVHLTLRAFNGRPISFKVLPMGTIGNDRWLPIIQTIYGVGKITNAGKLHMIQYMAS